MEIVGNQSVSALKALTSVKDAPESEKAWAKEYIKQQKTGDIKSDTILMSTKTFNKAFDNITTARKATGGGSVQTIVIQITKIVMQITICMVLMEIRRI